MSEWYDFRPGDQVRVVVPTQDPNGMPHGWSGELVELDEMGVYLLNEGMSYFFPHAMGWYMVKKDGGF